eukprot:1182368-Prorocentrum_minimum.AAC.5
MAANPSARLALTKERSTRVRCAKLASSLSPVEPNGAKSSSSSSSSSKLVSDQSPMNKFTQIN